MLAIDQYSATATSLPRHRRRRRRRLRAKAPSLDPLFPPHPGWERERTNPHNKFLTHLFRSITLHPRWPPRVVPHWPWDGVVAGCSGAGVLGG